MLQNPLVFFKPCYSAWVHHLFLARTLTESKQYTGIAHTLAIFLILRLPLGFHHNYDFGSWCEIEVLHYVQEVSFSLWFSEFYLEGLLNFSLCILIHIEIIVKLNSVMYYFIFWNFLSIQHPFIPGIIQIKSILIIFSSWFLKIFLTWLPWAIKNNRT